MNAQLWQINNKNRMRSVFSYLKNPLSLLVGIVLLSSLSSRTLAQDAVKNAHHDIKVEAKLDSSSIQIGQQTKLTLRVEYKLKQNDRILIQWPEIHDTLRKEIDVVEQTKVDTLTPSKEDEAFVQTKTLYITSFDSGYWAIQPFKFIVNGDTAGIYSDALLLSVSTIDIDTTQAIKDIKQPYSVTYSWIDWIKDHKLLVSGIVAGILALILLIYFIRKSLKNKPPPVVAEEVKVPPHIVALEKLEKLKNDKLWQEGKLKMYYITLTDIIREYIEHRFKIQAMEQTTEEILTSFRTVAIDKDSLEKLRQILLLGDLVKFAKEHPLPTENEMSMSNAFDFINGTKREEEIAPSPGPSPTE